MQHDARMGHPTHAYAYKPGSPVNCSVEVTSGLRNLSPLAKVTDELDPENISVCAINDQGGRTTVPTRSVTESLDTATGGENKAWKTCCVSTSENRSASA
jgi:hypothetical protein